MVKKIKRILNLIFYTSICLFLLLSIFCFSNTKSSHAEMINKKDSELYSPNSVISYADYKKAISLDCSGDICLIVDGKIVAFSGTQYIEYNSVVAPKTIKRIDDDKLLLSNNGSLYTISYTNTEFSSMSSAIVDTESNLIGGNYFDFNDNYLVTAYGTSAIIYNRKQSTLEFTKKDIDNTITITYDTPICINENDELFYFLDGYLCKKQIGGNISRICVASAKNIIANKDFIFLLGTDSISFIENQIFEDPSNISAKKLTVENYDSNYDLGSYINPTAISFNNDNLLIADEKAISEFSIDTENGVLSFTGFAISKGNTAYNRFSNDAIDIAKSGNTISILDSQRVMIISLNENDEKTYKNYLLSTLPIVPMHISLKQNILVCYNDDSYITIDINKDTISNVFPIAELSTINCYNEWEEGDKKQFDIAKTKYYLSNGNIKTSDSTNEYQLNLPTGLIVDNSSIKSFAMDFETKEIYFLLDGEEVVLSSIAFDNKTISEMDISSLKTTDKNAQPITDLKIFTANTPCELYKVSFDINQPSKLSYLSFIDSFSDELVLIFTFEDEYSDFYILSGYDENNREMFVLANKNNVAEQQIEITDCDGYAYVITPVDIYYLPLINYNRCYSIIDNGSNIRLSKETQIKTKHSLSINGNEFYYGEVTYKNTKYTCYIPKDFTVRVLAKEYITQTFTYKKVSNTRLFDKYGNYIMTLSEGSTIKLFNSEDVLCYVSYTDNLGEHFGFIEKSSIIEAPDNTIKIVICVLLLTTCAFITTFFLVFVKKDKH